MPAARIAVAGAEQHHLRGVLGFADDAHRFASECAGGLAQDVNLRVASVEYRELRAGPVDDQPDDLGAISVPLDVGDIEFLVLANQLEVARCRIESIESDAIAGMVAEHVQSIIATEPDRPDRDRWIAPEDRTDVLPIALGTVAIEHRSPAALLPSQGEPRSALAIHEQIAERHGGALPIAQPRTVPTAEDVHEHDGRFGAPFERVERLLAAFDQHVALVAR